LLRGAAEAEVAIVDLEIAVVPILHLLLHGQSGFES
jgi:hypothetical protein